MTFPKPKRHFHSSSDERGVSFQRRLSCLVGGLCGKKALSISLAQMTGMHPLVRSFVINGPDRSRILSGERLRIGEAPWRLDAEALAEARSQTRGFVEAKCCFSGLGVGEERHRASNDAMIEPSR